MNPRPRRPSRRLWTLATLVLLAGPVHGEDTYQLTLCGASPGGLWSLLGAGVDAALKAAHPGSTVTYQTSGGGFANVMQLAQHKCDLGLVHDAEASAAAAGRDPFRTPMDHLRTVAVMYTWAPMQLIVRRDFADQHGLRSLEDIAAKQTPVRLLLNRRGNVASQIGEALLSAAGAPPSAIESWGGSVTFAASKEQGELMRDRRADALLNSLFVGHGSIRQLAGAIELTLLPVAPQTAAKVSEDWRIAGFTIPDAAYDWSDGDVATVTLAAQLFVNADADERMVADLTAALVDHIDQVTGVHKAMQALTPALMASAGAVAYHPAAERVYRDKGLR